MFSPEIDYLVCKERIEELRQEAAHYQLVKIAMLQRPTKRESFRRIAGRFGHQMVKWGLKLQSYGQGQHQTVTPQGG